jgi:hypothetical protein
MLFLQLAFVKELVNGRAKLQEEDIRKALAEGKPSEEVGLSSPLLQGGRNCEDMDITRG